MLVVNKDNFEEEVKRSALPVVVDLWGPQCGPCLALMPDIEKLGEEFAGRVKIGKINVAENRRLCIELKVMSVPTFLFYKGGECVSRISGNEVSLASVRAGLEALL
jgi:thioredoxin 1